ncbi:leukocyte immunoglobulin-like receptor subfamily B member 3 [Cricetulus griseus]|uniref:Leukocyte immunoglobulin-like receptor subfamily B member 3 n=1 Tax=Cricetulus griseus TaxID=10029 RepID=A0A9J7K1K2_CRIGR|nr:leukocyte immunoglobulin-like receptor subfamily B member 3 [Cricetulus griseus]
MYHLTGCILYFLGVYHGKPSLSALPSPVVMAGGNVTLQCVSSKPYDCFIITGEDPNFSSDPKAVCTNTVQSQAHFPEIPVTSSKSGPFTCYGYHKTNPHIWSEASNSLEIHVSGLSKEPTLLTLQGPVLAPRDNLTLQCCSDKRYDRFALSKEGGSHLPLILANHTQAGGSHANFTLVSVNFSTGGRYRCHGSYRSSSELSAPSDPLDILITGRPPVTPNLSAHPGPTVSSGEKVTLLCQSSTQVDSFLLFKEGASPPYTRQISKRQDPQYEAEFSFSAVTSDFGGTYRCFGTQSSSPYLLSHSSVPVEIIVSGLAGYQKTLIAVFVGILFLLCLLALFLLLRLRHQNKCRNGDQTKTNLQHPAGAAESVTTDRSIQKSSSPAPAIQEEIFYTTVKSTQIKDSMELDIMSQHEEDHPKDLYAQVKPSRLRRAEPNSPRLMPKELPDSKERQAKEDQERGHQAAASKGTHEVIYSQLTIMTPRERQLNLTSLKQKSPT